ncbi:MAG TPA: hypothetical protein VLR70_08810, partial [Arthrobacter sp.]|nr:hypothetical protein [Arthrobacter sp.]
MTSSDPAPLRRARSSRYSGRRSMVLVAAVLPLAIGMAACSATAPTVTSDPSGPAGPVSTAPAPATADPSAAPVPAPSGVSGAVEAALQGLLASSPQPSREQVRESLTAAG